MSLGSLPSNWLFCSSPSSSMRQDWSVVQLSVAGFWVIAKNLVVCCNKHTLYNKFVVTVILSASPPPGTWAISTPAPDQLITSSITTPTFVPLSPDCPSCYSGKNSLVWLVLFLCCILTLSPLPRSSVPVPSELSTLQLQLPACPCASSAQHLPPTSQ